MTQCQICNKRIYFDTFWDRIKAIFIRSSVGRMCVVTSHESLKAGLVYVCQEDYDWISSHATEAEVLLRRVVQ